MKTKLVRPALVELTFNSIEEMQGDIILRDGILYTCSQLNTLQQHKKQVGDKVFQLILISLEDKFEVEDIVCDGIKIMNATPKIVNAQHLIDRREWRKVIATQPQLSPEYIQQFIKEYNKGEMKDFKIEMEDRFGYCAKCNAYQFASFITCNYRPSCGGKIIQKDEPKLTNGYITIVNTMKAEEKLQQAAKEYCEYLPDHMRMYDGDFIDCFMDGAKSPESLEYWKEKEKLWTNEEMFELLNTFRKDFSLHRGIQIMDTGLKEWFNQHKK